jgi:hypothetical protein
MADKKNNRKKLSLGKVLEAMGYMPAYDTPLPSISMDDPYDRQNADLSKRNFGKNSYPVRKPDAKYTEKFSEMPNFNNLDRVYSNMPQYTGVSQKEKNRKKLAAALAPFIGRLLPF